LRTFKGHLLNGLNESDFKDGDGNWYKAGGDGAVFYSLIENADPDKIKVVTDIVYRYNDASPINDYKVNGKIQTQNAQDILKRSKAKEQFSVIVPTMWRCPNIFAQSLSSIVDLDLVGEIQTLSSKFSCPNDGFSFPEVEPRLFSFNSPYGACDACNGLGKKHFFGDEPCSKCNGTRLREEALHIKVGGKNIVELTAMTTDTFYAFFVDLELSQRETQIAAVVLREVTSRVEFLLNVGLEYLTLDRRANTLSGGEAQRIRLASQLGSKLVGALYVLDEPTIGLHQRDNERLIQTLTALRDLGNTIIVVEHDEDTIFASDYLVDIGPGAGVHGGEIVAAGYLDDLLAAKKNTNDSLTLAYLRGEVAIALPKQRRVKEKGEIVIKGGRLFNIKDLNVSIPLGRSPRRKS
jgi:excinuclease UvrABC ATPase subunit